jgi:hypothetical protein
LFRAVNRVLLGQPRCVALKLDRFVLVPKLPHHRTPQQKGGTILHTHQTTYQLITCTTLIRVEDSTVFRTSIIPDDDDGGTPAELFWGLRASILVVVFMVNTCVNFNHLCIIKNLIGRCCTIQRGVGSTSYAIWRCFQSLALITLTAKCNAQLFFSVLHSVGIVVPRHVRSFAAQLCYLRSASPNLLNSAIASAATPANPAAAVHTACSLLGSTAAPTHHHHVQTPQGRTKTSRGRANSSCTRLMSRSCLIRY